MHPFRLYDNVMLHKSNLQSYRRPSFRGSDCQFSHAFCFSYSIYTRSVWMTVSRQEERKEITGKLWRYWKRNSEVWLKHNTYLLGVKALETCRECVLYICFSDLKEKSNFRFTKSASDKVVCISGLCLVVCLSLMGNWQMARVQTFSVTAVKHFADLNHQQLCHVWHQFLED